MGLHARFLELDQLTATQAAAIPTPADGTLVYVSDTDATFTRIGLWQRVSSAWVFVNIGSASTTAEGGIELATQTEVDAGTDSTRAITPATLSSSSLLDSAYGDWYVYENAVEFSIEAIATYQLITGGATVGLLNGVTFDAGSLGSITNTADSGGQLRCTDVGHGLVTGDLISLSGMGDVAHDGRTLVTRINDDTFDCDDIAYNSISDTGEWQQGASLTIASGHGGIYTVVYNASSSPANANKTFKFEIFINATENDKSATEQKYTSIGISTVGGHSILSLLDGDVVAFGIKNQTDATNTTINHCNVSIHRIASNP